MPKSLAIILTLLTLAAALACAAPPPPTPTATPVPTATPDIPATVAAAIAAKPTPTAYPTYTPYPTHTPRPTLAPTPTLGPLDTWKSHSPHQTYAIQLPREFRYTLGLPYDDNHWGFAHFDAHDYSVEVRITDGPIGNLVNLDLPRIASAWARQPLYSDYFVVDVVDFRIVSPTEARGSYRMTRYAGNHQCDPDHHVMFVRTDSHVFRVSISMCDSVRWKYDDEFIERVLNSFTWP